MRKMMAALLAAAAVTAPATAQRSNPGDGGVQAAPERTERSEQRQLAREGMRQALGGGDRQERREARQEFRQEQRADGQAFRQDRRDDRQEGRRDWQDRRREWRQGDVNGSQDRGDRAGDLRDGRRDRWDNRRDWQRDGARDSRDWQRDGARDGRDWQRDGARDGRFGHDGNRWGGNDRNRGGNWNRDWRRDPRYNFQDWRQRNRGSYRFPRYAAPRGWDYGYRRFSFGMILSAPLWSQNYWISDPWEYRLPPAYGPYRWVRYYDDVVLVDMRDGRVVDVIYDFFW